MNLDSGYAFSQLGIRWYAEAVVDAYCLWTRFFCPKLEDLMAESSDSDYCDECEDRWEDADLDGASRLLSHVPTRKFLSATLVLNLISNV